MNDDPRPSSLRIETIALFVREPAFVSLANLSEQSQDGKARHKLISKGIISLRWIELARRGTARKEGS